MPIFFSKFAIPPAPREGGGTPPSPKPPLDVWQNAKHSSNTQTPTPFGGRPPLAPNQKTINYVEKKSILSVIKSFLKIKKEQRLAASIENYNQELETAESEYENGNYISHEEMLKQIKQW